MEEYLWEITETSDQRIREMIEESTVTRPIAATLVQRGIEPENVQKFLFPALRNMVDPFLLPGAETAAARLWEAIHKGERILIFGDYDTDGITSTALTSWVLRKNGANVKTVLPHRIDDGYGLTAAAVSREGPYGCDVMLTVDCGVTSYEAADAARRLGVDLIVTDHHMPGKEMVQAHAVVDPKLPGSPKEVQTLAGVGVAFKVCHAFIKYGRQNGLCQDETDLREGMDLVALGTVADIVPLLDENRILVKFGLEELARQQRPGVHALCEISSVRDGVQTSDITYRLAPRLNAAGRMGDPNDSLKLLEATSMVDAFTQARLLDERNRERQSIEEEVVRNAEEQINEIYNLEQDRTIVVRNDEWHQGVVGIVASRLTRNYHRPSVVLSRDPSGQLTGSARSIRRLNLVDILDDCKETLTRYGGHAMAAGLSLKEECLDAFREQFEAAVRTVLSVNSMKPSLEVSSEVSFAELTDEFFTELEMLAPFGHGNPEPIFVARDVYPERITAAGKNHSRGYLRDASGARIAFIAFRRPPDTLPPAPWDLAYTPHINHFAGNATPQARIVDIREC
ncbi:MAG: single-stranded-DNA-specific exonuclease RecJ [Lentisphaeria bacterium]|nr:single-stranded-DNA-specific exonuclease RecJ [Lentisphaeria bacterium]